MEKLCNRVGIIREGGIIETGSLRELRYLTRVQILLETKEKISNLHKLKGIHQLEKRENGLSFQVVSEEMDAVLKHISQFGVTKLESAPPRLEDLFMRHYKGGESKENYTMGAMMAHQMLLFTALAVGLMSILLVSRHTRGDRYVFRGCHCRICSLLLFIYHR